MDIDYFLSFNFTTTNLLLDRIIITINAQTWLMAIARMVIDVSLKPSLHTYTIATVIDMLTTMPSGQIVANH